MKKIILLLMIFFTLVITSCSDNTQINDEKVVNGAIFSENEGAFGEDISAEVNKGYFDGEANEVEITYVSGTQGAYKWDGNTLTFTALTEDSIYSIAGKLKGNIVIDIGENYKLDLELCGFSLVCDSTNPIAVLSGDKVTVTAKKDHENFIYDKRKTVDSEDETATKGAIYALCDLEICGKGALTISSDNNNGIHTKDDLEIKNLTLVVVCNDNALKGNDSVTLKSGKTTLIATQGDGIKSSNSDISEKGKQRGTVTVLDGEHNILAGCDGVDASYNVEIGGEAVLNIYTGKFSNYTDEALINEVTNNSTEYAMPNNMGGFGGGMGKPQRPGGSMGGPGGMGGHGGMGGFEDGNSEKSTYSAKGIKSNNEIIIAAGKITVKSQDDAIHANNDEALENGDAPLGQITVSGGMLNLYSSDDGIHADNKVTINNGEVYITNSYEGIEGAYVNINGGNVSVIARDDGINGTASTGTSVSINSGNVYVYCSGDGIDTNTRESYAGIVFAGGETVVISTSGGNSAIDTEMGYAYTGGKVIALMPTGSMTNEATHCQSFQEIATSQRVSVSADDYLNIIVDGISVKKVKMPVALNGYAIYLGSNSANILVE